MQNKASKSWYGESQTTKLGKQLVKGVQPVSSNELSDLELLTSVTRSPRFAKQFLEQKQLEDLLKLNSPRELLLYPAATPAVISRAWLLIEFYARMSEKNALQAA